MLFANFEKPEAYRNFRFVLKHEAKILNQISFLALINPSVQTLICFKHSFSPPWQDKAYHDWREKGLVSIKDMYTSDKLASFSQFKGKYSLLHSHLFRYLQVRHYIQWKIENFDTLLLEHGIYDILKSPSDSRHLITKLYTYLAFALLHTLQESARLGGTS